MASKCKFLFAAMFILIVLSSTSFATVVTDAEIFMRIHLEPSRRNATKEMLNVYSFIASNYDLSETTLALGAINTQVCDIGKQRKDNLTIAYAKMKDFINPVNMVYSYEVAQTPQNKRLKGLLMDVRMHLRATVNALRRMQKKDNLSIAFIQLYNFIRPLYLAYSCEEAKGSQHKVLARVLKDTSFHLNNTVWRLRREIKKTGSSIPTVQHISEASFDHYTTTYLQAMVNMKRVSLTLTDNVVKIYRNYVILYTLKDVLIDVLTCI